MAVFKIVSPLYYRSHFLLSDKKIKEQPLMKANYNYKIFNPFFWTTATI